MSLHFRVSKVKKQLSVFVRCCMSSSRFPTPDLDFDYLCDPKNKDEISTNILRRKASGNIDIVLKLYEDLKREESPVKRQDLKAKLMAAALQIPNKSHSDILQLKEEPKILSLIGEKKTFSFKPLSFPDISKRLNLARTEDLSNLTGPRSYFLMDDLAMLEQALINYSLKGLLKKNFQLISVPDILDREVIEGCGMETRGERNQVYSLDANRHGKDLCLSGTAEMGIARHLINKTFSTSELPKRFAAVSRCYRAETSKISEEKGIYRVHQFTKVEMFSVCLPDDSSHLMEEFRQLQEENFSSLGLHIRTLDMPPCDLGQPAFRKYDVEGYMPGRDQWGELSSTSDCTDYQARRLSIRSKDGTHLHTVNGTSCAVPRLIIAIFESHQRPDGCVEVPPPLIPYMGKDIITKSRLSDIKPYKQRRDVDCLVNK